MYPQSTADRFWQNVIKSDQCWLWQASRIKAGYGQFYAAGGTRMAHRMSWELTYGPIPKNILVCHHCDIPSCVRPDHLFLGTDADNLEDAYRKGRTKYPHRPVLIRRRPSEAHNGVDNGRAVLNESQVRQIRLRYASESTTYQELASIYGVSLATVAKIVSRQTWKHLL